MFTLMPLTADPPRAVKVEMMTTFDLEQHQQFCIDYANASNAQLRGNGVWVECRRWEAMDAPIVKPPYVHPMSGGGGVTAQ
jgi:hypothetical protein